MMFYLRWCFFVIVAGMVMYGIFRPMPPPMIFEQSDKLGHVSAFLALALTARMAMNRVSATVFWLVMFLLAFGLEYLQGEFRPLRVFSAGDVCANVLGVVLALIVCFKWGKWRAS